MVDTKLFKVDKKEEIRRMVKGEQVTLYRIYATTTGGTYFSLDVLADIVDAGKADALLNERAKAIDAIT